MLEMSDGRNRGELPAEPGCPCCAAALGAPGAQGCGWAAAVEALVSLALCFASLFPTHRGARGLCSALQKG